jgi:hypothetical protein
MSADGTGAAAVLLPAAEAGAVAGLDVLVAAAARPLVLAGAGARLELLAGTGAAAKLVLVAGEGVIA